MSVAEGAPKLPCDGDWVELEELPGNEPSSDKTGVSLTSNGSEGCAMTTRPSKGEKVPGAVGVASVHQLSTLDKRRQLLRGSVRAGSREAPPPDGSADMATEGIAGDGGARRGVFSRRREALRLTQVERQEAEENTTERWSGLRIAERCVRKEKWDASMQGKDLVPLSCVGGMVPAARDAGRDKVLIGVLCSVPPKKDTLKKPEFVEWSLTDLARHAPYQVTLVLSGRAMHHWADQEGAGRTQATLGSIFAVLNPTLTGRADTLRLTVETQLCKLGNCPAFGQCGARLASGSKCRRPYNSEIDKSCIHHIGAVLTEPQRHKSSAPPNKCRSVLLSAAEKSEKAIDGAVTGAELSAVLERLEGMEVDAWVLNQTSLYEKVGTLAQRADDAGARARRLRRVWRVTKDQANAENRRPEVGSLERPPKQMRAGEAPRLKGEGRPLGKRSAARLPIL